MSQGDAQPEASKWRRIGDVFRNSETTDEQALAPPGVAEYWIRRSLIILERKYESFDEDNSGAIDLNELMNPKRTGHLRKAEREELTALFKEVDVNKSGELDFSEFFALIFNWTVRKKRNGLELLFSSEKGTSISALDELLEGFWHLADFVNTNSREINGNHCLDFDAVKAVLRGLYPNQEENIASVMQRHFLDETKPLSRLRYFLMILYDLLSIIPDTGVKGSYITGFEGYLAPDRDWTRESQDVVIENAVQLLEHRFTEFAINGERSIQFEGLLKEGRLWISAQDKEKLEDQLKKGDIDGSKSLDFAEFFVLLQGWAAGRQPNLGVLKSLFPSPANRSLVRAAVATAASWLTRYGTPKAPAAPYTLSRAETDRLVADFFPGSRYPVERYVTPAGFAGGKAPAVWAREALKVLEQRFAEFDIDGSGALSAEEMTRGLPIGYEERKQLQDTLRLRLSKSMSFVQFVGAVSAAHLADKSNLSRIFPSKANQELLKHLFRHYTTNARAAAASLDAMFDVKELPDRPDVRQNYEKVKGRFPREKMTLETYITVLYNVFSMERSSLKGDYLGVEIYPLSEALRRLEHFYRRRTIGGKRVSDILDNAPDIKADLEKLISAERRALTKDFEFPELLECVLDTQLREPEYAPSAALTFLFKDPADPLAAEACVRGIADLARAVVSRLGAAAGAAVWQPLNEQRAGEVLLAVDGVVCELFPRYQGAYLERTRDAVETLRRAARGREVGAGRLMHHLYMVQCELKGSPVDPSLRLEGTYKEMVMPIDVTATVKRMQVQFGQEFEPAIEPLAKDVEEAEKFCGRHDTNETGKKLAELRERNQALKDEYEALQSKLANPTKASPTEAALQEMLEGIQKAVEHITKDVQNEKEEEEAAKKAKPDEAQAEAARAQAFLARETLVRPEEQLGNADRDMVDALVRNPGVGPCMLSFIIVYFGLSVGKSSVSSLLTAGSRMNDEDGGSGDNDANNESVEADASHESADTPGDKGDKGGGDGGNVESGDAGGKEGEKADDTNSGSTTEKDGGGGGGGSAKGKRHTSTGDKSASGKDKKAGAKKGGGGGGGDGSPESKVHGCMKKFAGKAGKPSDGEDNDGPSDGGDNDGEVESDLEEETGGVHNQGGGKGEGGGEKGGLVQKLLDEVHVRFSVGVSALLPFVLLLVQYAYVGLIFTEAYDAYKSKLFCPGYDYSHYHLLEPDEGADNDVRLLMIFIGIYFLAKTFSQAAVYMRSLTERTMNRKGMPAHASVGSIRHAVAGAFRFIVRGCKHDDSDAKKLRHPPIMFRGRICNKCSDECKLAYFCLELAPLDIKGKEGGAAGAHHVKAADTTPTDNEMYCAKCAMKEDIGKEMRWASSRFCDYDGCDAEGCYRVRSDAYKDTALEGVEHDAIKKCSGVDQGVKEAPASKDAAANHEVLPPWAMLKVERFRFCRAHATQGFMYLQHARPELQPEGGKHKWGDKSLPAQAVHFCTVKGCLRYATHLAAKPKAKGPERMCKRHADKEIEKMMGDRKNPKLFCQALGASISAANTTALKDHFFPVKPKKEDLCRLWRDVQDSGIYPLYCIDVCVNLILVYSVLLCNLYIIFVTGSSVKDILSKVVILDFIYMLQAHLKRELLQGAQSKRFLEGVRGAYNFGGYIRVNKVCSSFFAKLLYLFNIFPFLISAVMTVYGPICKPGPGKIGIVPGTGNQVQVTS